MLHLLHREGLIPEINFTSSISNENWGHCHHQHCIQSSTAIDLAQLCFNVTFALLNKAQHLAVNGTGQTTSVQRCHCLRWKYSCTVTCCFSPSTCQLRSQHRSSSDGYTTYSKSAQLFLQGTEPGRVVPSKAALRCSEQQILNWLSLPTEPCSCMFWHTTAQQLGITSVASRLSQ